MSKESEEIYIVEIEIKERVERIRLKHDAQMEKLFTEIAEAFNDDNYHVNADYICLRHDCRLVDMAKYGKKPLVTIMPWSECIAKTWKLGEKQCGRSGRGRRLLT